MDILKNEEEKILYLANLIYALKIDKRVKHEEIEAIKILLKENDFSKELLEEAVKRVYNENYKLYYFDRLSICLRNFEDILFVLYSDQSLTLYELEIIEEFKTKLAISEEQLYILKYETQQRLKDYLLID